MIGWQAALRIRNNARSSRPIPESMQINITGRCPLKCWHCEKAVDQSGTDMAWELLIGCLDQAAAWNCSVLYTGGEPLVHKRWQDIIRAGNERQLSQKMVTSGLGLSSLDSADRLLLTESLDETLISIDSADAATHDQLRGCQGLFANLVAFLADHPHPETVWLVHVPQADLESVFAMIDLAAKYHVGLIVQPFIFISNFPHLVALESKSEVQQSLPELAPGVSERALELANIAERKGVISNLAEVALYIGKYYELSHGNDWYGHHIMPDFVCSVPWQQVTIDEYGQLLPCVFMKGKQPVQGESLDVQWQQQAKQFRTIQQGGKTWPECSSCTCHFGSNFRNSLLMSPWQNRAGWGIVLNKKLNKLIQQSPFHRRDK